MNQDDWELEMNHMLVSFANQAVYSLGKISRRFEKLGRPFDEKFRQYYLKMSHQRLDMSYDTVLFAKENARCNETESKTNIPPSNDEPADVMNTGESKNAVKLKVEITDDDTIIDIDDSDDDEHSGMQAANDLAIDHSKASTSNGSLAHSSANQNAASESKPIVISMVERSPNKGIETVLEGMESGEGSSAQQKNPSSNAVRKANRRNRLKCEHCDNFFEFRFQLKEHLKVHVNGRLVGIKADSNGLYHCTLCVRQFINVSYLSNHMKSHDGNHHLYYCARCLRPFDQEIYKMNHERVCDGRHFECHLCKVHVTKNYAQMQNHMRTHSGIRPFRCTVCSKFYTQQGCLKRHLRSVHGRIHP